ncbi:MAG: DUF58 domain-containing protein [Stackebrandtia sp.]
MGEAFRGLTLRGKSLISVSVALVLLSFLLGEKDLMRAAALVGILPLASVVVISRTRYRISSSRVLDPVRVEVGQQARVTLRLRNRSRVPTGTMMLEDRLPYALGNRPRLVLERLLGGGGSAVSYTVCAENRGRYDIGPLIVRLTDPFGLVELTRSYPAVDHLTVIPTITPLPTVRMPGEHAASGDSRSRAVAVHGDDDAATREYRHGDDLRRVHWPTTAKAGELMVRREEQPWDSRATVLLDVRAAGHRGESVGSSFEWAVSAAASVTHNLRVGGYKLRMVTETADLTPETSGDGAIMDHLAAVRTERRTDVGGLIEQLNRRDRGGLIVAILGMVTEKEAKQLAGLRTSGATCVALLMDATTWQQLPEGQRGEADRAFQSSTLTLMRAGWRVIAVRHGAHLPHLWHELSRGTQGFAERATMAETISGGSR